MIFIGNTFFTILYDVLFFFQMTNINKQFKYDWHIKIDCDFF